jgi:uncharacterized protein YjbI with pentapeptide repeats
MIITIYTQADAGARVLYAGEHASDAEALTYCAANGVDLTRADLSGRTWDDADISGLVAPTCDLRTASCRRVKALGPLPLVLAASQLQGSVWDDAELLVANLACTHPTSFARVRVSAQTDLSGIDWSDCSDR